jgi:hypothetical protein
LALNAVDVTARLSGMTSAAVDATHKPWIDEADLRLDDFRAQVLRTTDPADYPMAIDVWSNVPVYSAATLQSADRRALQSELIRALADGPGVVVFEGAFDAGVVDQATDAFFAIIDAQRAAGSSAGDHFGKPGANDRIWNAAQKLALHDPQVFADYYANDALAVVCQAWLGPRYQVTSQVNVVNPGGKQQVPHRDYHLGFVPDEHLAAYPAHLHRMSPVLTLQGAVAHCDMPVESGCRSRSDSRAATSRSTGPSLSTSSPSITCKCRSPRATRCSSIQRCITVQDRMFRHTSAGSPICCRSRRRSVARWRRWIAPRWCAPSIRRCAR